MVEIFDYILSRLNQFNISFEIIKSFGKKFKNTQNPTSKTKEGDSPNKNQDSKNFEHHVKLNLLKNNFEIQFFFFICFALKDSNFIINENPIKVNELRLVCDNMLAGLGKELRRCGVDTVILENGKEHTEVAQVSSFIHF